MSKYIAYCRVSTSKQDLEKQRLSILDYANKNEIKINEFIEVEISSRKDARSRRLPDLLERLKPGDSVIVAELSRLGRSVGEIARLVDDFIRDEKGLICIKEGIVIPANGKELSMTAEIQVTMFSLFAKIERKLISERTKAGLEAVKAQGRRLGRPKGTGKSKLDPYKNEIIDKIKMGVTKSRIAGDYGVTEPTLYRWLKRHKIEV